MKTITVAVILFGGLALGQAKKDLPTDNSGAMHATNTMNEIYRDESHCLTQPDMRSDKDSQISCYCRDAIVDARYVYFTYIQWPMKDANLTGTFLALQQRATDLCGGNYESPPKATVDQLHHLREGKPDIIYAATTTEDWKWNGPEVVRTYPPDDVIQRISPEKKDGKPTGRWVPYTVQLIYRDAQGRVTRTENYASREFEPVTR